MRHKVELTAKRIENRTKAAAYAKIYYAKNAEKLKARSAARLEAKRDEINAAERARYDPDLHWRKKKPERAKFVSREYVKRVADKRRVYEQNRRARKKQLSGELPVDIKEILFRLQRGRCACCGLPLGSDFHLDHKQPITKGGTNTPHNLQLLRKKCNLRKQAKDPIAYMQEKGFLL
jgi:5-methylcytosine-specific restriction endonuclease McrA